MAKSVLDQLENHMDSNMSKIDSRLYHTIWAEAAGGSPEEIKATASTFLNRVDEQGYEKALRGSSAYRKRSPEYLKASKSQLNEYELKKYLEMSGIVDTLVKEPTQRDPWTFFENLTAIGKNGEPYWVKSEGLDQAKDIGRQRFYTRSKK
jgi:hypothetical protein